jgi:hypothetical protein
VILIPKPGNPPLPWFWGSTKKPSASFEAKPGETVITSFEAKQEKTVITGFKAKPEKTVTAGFEAKHLEIVAAGFDAKPPETILFTSPSKRLNDYYASNAQYIENGKGRIAGSDATRRFDQSVFNLPPMQPPWWCHVHHPPSRLR